MIKDLFVTAFIADIHFGSSDPERLYNELKVNFLNVLKGKRIDLVVLGGDTFHNVISMNTITSRYVLLFMEKLLKICKKNGIKHIRVIQGTMSHDNNQLNVFKMYENDPDIDFKIVLTLTEEDLPEGIRILYVPEEYLLNSNHKNYYDEYLNCKKRYDMILGHGTFKESHFAMKNQESEIGMSSAPVFDSKYFVSACSGPIYFGHIHKKLTIREHIHYPGSFSRFCHGEENDKGWFLSVYDKNTSKYVHEFIVNNLAPKYITKEISLDEFDNLYELVLTKPSIQTFDFLKVRIMIEKEDEEIYLKEASIKELCSGIKNVKIEFIDKEDKEKELEEKIITEVYESGYTENYTSFDTLMEYLYGESKELKHEEKIQKFISKKYAKNVPIEVIKDVLELI